MGSACLGQKQQNQRFTIAASLLACHKYTFVTIFFILTHFRRRLHLRNWLHLNSVSLGHFRTIYACFFHYWPALIYSLFGKAFSLKDWLNNWIPTWNEEPGNFLAKSPRFLLQKHRKTCWILNLLKVLKDMDVIHH